MIPLVLLLGCTPAPPRETGDLALHDFPVDWKRRIPSAPSSD